MPGFFEEAFRVFGYAKTYFTGLTKGHKDIESRKRKVKKIVSSGKYRDAFDYFSKNEDDIYLPLDTPSGLDKDEQHVTALILAVIEKKTEVVRCLFDLEIDPNKSKSFLGRSCLHYAGMICSCPIEVIHILCENKAGIEDHDYKGMTPSHYAGKHGNAKFLTHLLDTYDYEDITLDEQGRSTFELATENGYMHIVSKLAKFRRRLSNGLTEKGSVLSLASDNGSVDQDDMELVTGKLRKSNRGRNDHYVSLPALMENTSGE